MLFLNLKMEGPNKRLWVHLDLEPQEEAILGELINLTKSYSIFFRMQLLIW